MRASTVAITDSSRPGRRRVRPASGRPRRSAELATRAEVDGHGFVEAALRAHHAHHALAGAQAYLVDRDHVERVGHGQHEVALGLHAQGEDAMTHDEVARQQADGHGRRRLFVQVRHVDVHLAGKVSRTSFISVSRPSRTRMAPSRPPCSRCSAMHVSSCVLSDGAGPAAGACRAAAGPWAPSRWRRSAPSMRARRSDGSKGFGDHVRGAQALAFLEVEAADRAGQYDADRARQLGSLRSSGRAPGRRPGRCSWQSRSSTGGGGRALSLLSSAASSPILIDSYASLKRSRTLARVPASASTIASRRRGAFGHGSRLSSPSLGPLLPFGNTAPVLK